VVRIRRSALKKQEFRENVGEPDFVSQDEEAIPVISEELVIDKRPVATSGVRVHKHVDEHIETVDMPLAREEVDVRRVVINRVVDEIPPTREDGDLLIIPVDLGQN
jgi:stress response protein YsnF